MISCLLRYRLGPLDDGWNLAVSFLISYMVTSMNYCKIAFERLILVCPNQIPAESACFSSLILPVIFIDVRYPFLA